MTDWVLARGCYWGIEARFGVLAGVRATSVGLAHGRLLSSTSRGSEAAAEAVRVTLMGGAQAEQELLAAWYEDLPVELLAPDPVYRAALFVQDERQQHAAEAVIQHLQEAHPGRCIHIDLLKLTDFVPAPERHQKFLLRRFSGLLEALCGDERNEQELLHSQLGSRLNGFLAGFGSFEDLRDTLDALPLDKERKEFVYGRWFDA